MKRISIISLISAVVLATGCDYLDKAPGVDVNEDNIFSSQTDVETFLASIYRYGIHTVYGYGMPDNAGDDFLDPAGCPMSAMTDESEQCAPWYFPNGWNAGNVTSSNSHDYDKRWSNRWKAIRKVGLLQKRVGDVPDISGAYARQIVAEARVIRAMNYSELLKFYGGMPIIDHYIDVSEDLKRPRNTIDEVVEFIVKDCDESLADLPARQTGANKGRIDKGVALAIKARTLLLAASPIFNADEPYLQMANDKDNELICYCDYDEDRWLRAAAACKDVLDWAKTNGCKLITDQGVAENYRYSWEVYDNDEIILAEKGHGAIGNWTWPWSAIAPPKLYSGNAGQSGITVTLNHVRKYEKRDGTPQVWDGGDNLQATMAALDYRFAATICGNMMKWNSEFPAVELYDGGKHVDTCHGGFWLHKTYPSTISSTVYTYVPNSTIYQLNEFYLSYAEAMNEYYGPDDAGEFGMTAREAVNEIRRRSGQPDISGDGSKEAFRARIVNERAVELAFDNQRFFDVRRWLIAENEGIMNGEIWGIKISKIPGNNNEYHYEPYVFENRTFTRRMYLNPFSTNEINKGYLVQNPGY